MHHIKNNNNKMKTVAEIEELSNMVLQAEKDSLLSTNEAVHQMYFYSTCIDVIKMFNGNAIMAEKMLYNYQFHLEAIKENANILISDNLGNENDIDLKNYEIAECENVIKMLKFILNHETQNIN